MYKTLLFDTWGTLVDNYSIADVIEPYVGESHTAQHIAQDWRFQHKWAMFYTTLGERFVPHPGLNEACLRWALDLHHIDLPESAIEDHSRFAGTLPYIDEIISSGEEAKAFKPSPKVFRLGIERAGCATDEILWVTGHFWEAYAADGLGLKTAWTNRQRQPPLRLGFEPTYTTRNLQEVADILSKAQQGANAA